MNLRDHEGDIKDLLKDLILFIVEPVYVDNVARWCEENGYEEPDKENPIKLIVDEERGSKLVISEQVPDSVIDDRIKEMGVRASLQDVATDREAMLNSEKKKVAYLLLHEYASNLPENEEDELLMDNWAFDKMKTQGYFKE